MIKIENKIRQNKEAFNASEPGPGHMDRFSARLDQLHESEKESWFERYQLALRIAAVVAIFITFGVVFYSGGFSGVKDMFSQQIVAAELPEEVQEVMVYYNLIADNKVDEINELAVSDSEADRVTKMAMFELKALEESRVTLEKEYQQNPENQRVLNALLVNQQKKAEIMDKILKSLNQIN